MNDNTSYSEHQTLCSSFMSSQGAVNIEARVGDEHKDNPFINWSCSYGQVIEPKYVTTRTDYAPTHDVDESPTKEQKKARKKGRPCVRDISFIDDSLIDAEKIADKLRTLMEDSIRERDKVRVLVAAMDVGLLKEVPTDPVRIWNILRVDLGKKALDTSQDAEPKDKDKWECRRTRGDKKGVYIRTWRMLQEWKELLNDDE